MADRILYLAISILLTSGVSSQEYDCHKPLGMADRRIPDSSLSASSQYNSWHGVKHGRLNNNKGATVWMAAQNVAGEYIQVDLGDEFVITGVVTQGRNWSRSPQYIKEYYVGFSSDGKNFQNVTNEEGKLELFKAYNHASSNLLYINARYFRLYASKWFGKVCTQLELYGCRARNCSVNNGGCNEKCVQVNKGVVMCGCHQPGYKLVNGVCQDINECTEHKLCAHDCTNTNGSYVCSCRKGYSLGRNGRSCVDIDECQGNHTCDQLCQNTPGSYRCVCKPGYKFGSGGFSEKCIDVNECSAGTSGCEHLCNNTIGSFKCSCRDGYELDFDGKSCADINECQRPYSHKCEQICLNNDGGYSCKCRQGYELAQDGYVCDDINECEKKNGGCSDQCTNTIGSFICSCPKGFRLKIDYLTCEDVNECRRDNGNCSHFCKNEIGKYRCECRAGYRLMNDGYGCEDINECVEMSPCDAISMNCVNTMPSYRCDCKPGFEPMSGSPPACQRVKCGAISVDPKFTVSPPRCLLSERNVFGDTCTFKCAAGYEAVDPSNMKATCLANRRWSMRLPQCIGVKCPAISQLSNGNLYPPECAYGIRYPGTCSIRCNSGYNNIGPSRISCQSSGSFSFSVADVGCQKDTVTPIISCPAGIVAELPPGSKSMIVTWKDPVANVGKIKSSHDINFLFPVGITTVTFTATNDGKSDSCSIRVTILDKEDPKVIYCPKDLYVTKIPGETVTWSEPQFKDNVGVVSVDVIPANKRGTDLPEDDYRIIYTARDEAGNYAVCNFNVFVTEKSCSDSDFTVNSATTDKVCNPIPGDGYYCFATCKQGKVFVQQPQTQWYICHFGSWNPPPESVPDCTDYSKFVDTCPEGTFELTDQTVGKVCANCPAGTFYSNGVCEKCQPGSYQDEEKKLSCKKCPAHQGTTTSGAKKCKNLCIPGTYSSSGFPTDNESCKLCGIGEYQPNYGSTSCLKCSGNTTTVSSGETSRNDCGRKGDINITPTGQTNFTEGQNVEFVCHTSAYPSFSISWKKVKPENQEDYVGGKVTKKDVYDSNGRLVGRSYSITQVKYHDRGVYLCETTNRFGVVQKCFALNVLKNFG